MSLFNIKREGFQSENVNNLVLVYFCVNCITLNPGIVGDRGLHDTRILNCRQLYIDTSHYCHTTDEC